MSLFAHHAEAFIAIEVNGRSFPDGMTEHALVITLAVAVLALTAYGLYAAARDFLRWRKSPALAKA